MGTQKFKPQDVVNALNATKGMVYVAARQLGCSANTVYNYAKRYPAVQAAIDEQRGSMLDTAELALWKAIQNGEGWAISLALKTIGKSRGYVERMETVSLNVDTDLLKRAIDALESAGLDAAQVFNDLIAEAAAVKQDAGAANAGAPAERA